MKLLITVLIVALLIISPVCGANFVSTVESPADVDVQPLPGYTYQGPAPDDLTVLVNIAVPLKNADLLGSTLKQVSDPSSSMFRHFLTLSQIEQKFLPTNEHESMLAYIKNAGLPIISDSLKSIIVVQATVAQINTYFHANVDLYSNGKSSYYATSGNSVLNGARFVASNATALMIKPKLADQLAAKPNANITFSQGAFSAKDLQTVYNATSLYAQGFQGDGQIIGILEFFGSPTITQDLSQFNKKFGFPDSTLNVIPIAPYNPNLGVSVGWSTETSLDVESAHAMAPEATVDLYVTTEAYSFAADIASIINYNRATTLSMSFSLAPEWLIPLIGGQLFYFNMLLPDQYFMLGSLLGISFLCSSGDAGGSGFSSGPAGNSAYPSDSPYVTSTGGTQTYLYTQANGSKTFVQTGWSNPGYVPNGVNVGGSGGGVSFLIPKPWYQQNQPTPPSYPNGRMEPDLSLQAGIDPGIIIVDGGTAKVVGGTSASVQILSGLLTLVAQSSGGPLGLINPFLYSIGNNQTSYAKAYTPITFGYNIPWATSYGYNLVTGWGSPNIGEIAQLYNTQLTQPALSIFVELTDSEGQSPIEFFPNQTIYITAFIDNGLFPVTIGTFTSQLVTLTGSALAASMSYNSSIGGWTSSLTLEKQSGIAYVEVNGSSAGLTGAGFAEIFAGYLATFYAPSPTNPWITASGGLQVIVSSTDLEGNSAPLGPLNMQIKSYSILSNQFTTVDTVSLQPTNITGLSNVTSANLTSAYPAGPLTLMITGSTYGFLPFINGIYLQNSLIFPEVAVSPGAIGPGQYLTIITDPIAPLNIANISSADTGNTIGSDVSSGSSVTAYLISPTGTAVATANLAYQGTKISGLLQIPSGVSAGLYTILLGASYSSLTLGYTLNGVFYSKIWISNATITPAITISPSTVYMGQTAQISADLHYPSGQEVTQGEYTAIIYPQRKQNQFTEIMYEQYLNGQLTPLTYSQELNRWIANITMPSPYDANGGSSVGGDTFDYSGPYETYVTGISYDGVPTTTALSAQQGFIIKPYVYISNNIVTSLQQNWGLALNGINITGTTNIDNSIFLDSNYIQNCTTTISDSVINGTITVVNANLTLRGVHDGNIVAINSAITLINSDIARIALANSNISLTSSTYQTITPPPPTIHISSPTNGASYTGNIDANITVTGNNVNSITVSLNGLQIQTFNNNGSFTFPIPSNSYADGTYALQVTANQTTGLTSSVTSTIYFTNQASSTQSTLNSLNSAQSALQNQVNSLKNSVDSLTSQQTALQNQINNLKTSLQNNLNNMNQSQNLLQNQLDNATKDLSSLNATLNELQNQAANQKNNLSTTQNLASIGIAIGAAGIIVAVAVLLKRNKKSILAAN